MIVPLLKLDVNLFFSDQPLQNGVTFTLDKHGECSE